MDECHTFDNQCNAVIDLITNVGHNDPYFGPVILPYYAGLKSSNIAFLYFFCTQMYFSFVDKARYWQATLSCYSSYYLVQCSFVLFSYTFKVAFHFHIFLAHLSRRLTR